MPADGTGPHSTWTLLSSSIRRTEATLSQSSAVAGLCPVIMVSVIGSSTIGIPVGLMFGSGSSILSWVWLSLPPPEQDPSSGALTAAAPRPRAVLREIVGIAAIPLKERRQ